MKLNFPYTSVEDIAAVLSTKEEEMRSNISNEVVNETIQSKLQEELECGSMPTLPNIGGALCSTPKFGHSIDNIQ